MKRLAGMMSLMAALVISLPASLRAAEKQARRDVGALIGAWDCTGDAGKVALIFESANRLVFKGEAADYQLVPGAIRVREDYALVDYPYTLKGKNLAVTFPDGSRLQCVKSSASGRTSGASPERGGSNAQLRGMLCSWSGSSSSSSSYSRTTRVSFDGQGRFRYGSESSFSSGAGQAYGGGGGNHGTYRVSGSTVHLTFSDGSSAVARVNMRQNSGMITELMYNGTLYATGLCD